MQLVIQRILMYLLRRRNTRDGRLCYIIPDELLNLVSLIFALP